MSDDVTRDILTIASSGSGSPALLSPSEAARVLGVGISSVYKLMNSGELPFLHLLGKTKITAPDIADLVAKLRAETPERRVMPWDAPGGARAAATGAKAKAQQPADAASE